MAHGHDSLLEFQRGLPVDEPCENGCENGCENDQEENDQESNGQDHSDNTQRFETFSREQYNGLVAFLRRRLATEDDARDAAQESLMRLIRYRDTTSEPEWKPLLYRIAINVVGEHYRRGSARGAGRHVPLEGVELAADEPAQEDLVAREQQRALLRDAILSLPERQKQIYLLSRMQGMTYAQIARHCEISVKTVEKHMTNALAALCERVGSRVGDAF